MLGVLDTTLLDMLQAARDRVGQPLQIVSGWRCPPYNSKVKGITRSQHLQGRAVDVPRGYMDAKRWMECGAIGVGMRDGWVIHVDTEPFRRAYIFQE
jgi:uncharacterized protein YcbK (DUF882 family)